MNISVEGSKRQLPPWMMPKVGASHVSNSDNVVEANCCVEKRDEITANAENGTKGNAETDNKRETAKRKSNSNAKREVKRRRNSNQEGRSDGDDVVQKKKKKGNKSGDKVCTSSRKKRQNSEDPSHDRCDVYPVQASSDDDDVDLTVEDLMAIANLYVKDHEDKKLQQTSVRQCESKWQFPAKSESGATTLDSTCESRKPYSSSRESLCSSTPTTTGELIATRTSKTGPVVQDIMDLFFDSLLKKKPIEKEEVNNKSIVDSLEFTDEYTRYSQLHPVGEEVVTLDEEKKHFERQGSNVS